LEGCGADGWVLAPDPDPAEPEPELDPDSQALFWAGPGRADCQDWFCGGLAEDDGADGPDEPEKETP